MKLYEILWMIGVVIALISACGADSESLIPIGMVLIGCAVIAAGLVVKRVKALT